VNEAQWQTRITDLCDLLGLLWYHTHDSRRSPGGFPDLVIVGNKGIVYTELKAEKGKVSPKQWAWINALEDAGQRCYVWRPDDWEQVQDVLFDLAERKRARPVL
jgi:hypothetical protein